MICDTSAIVPRSDNLEEKVTEVNKTKIHFKKGKIHLRSSSNVPIISDFN